MLLRMFVDFHLCTCNQIAPVAACVSLMEFCYMNPNGTETGQNLLAQHTRTLYLFMILENFLYKLCFHDGHKYSDLNHVSEDESSIQLIILKVSSTSSKRVALNCGLNSVWEWSSASNMKVTSAAVFSSSCGEAAGFLVPVKRVVDTPRSFALQVRIHRHENPRADIRCIRMYCRLYFLAPKLS